MLSSFVPTSIPSSRRFPASRWSGIDGTLRLDEDLQLDSLKRIEVVSRVSEKYEFDPDVDTILELRTVDDVIRLMEELLHQA